MNLFIPYVFTTIGQEKIKDVIEKQECLGTVEKIDIVERVDDKTGKPFNMAYVHMKEWNHTHSTVETMNEIRKNGKKTVYYTQNKKGPYWSLVENTYKAKSTAKSAANNPTPPKLVRNEPFTTPELNRTDSVGECPGAPLRQEDFYAYASQLPSCTATNLTDMFDMAAEDDVEYETDGLVHESYVTQLENEVAMLRNLIVQMQVQAYGMGV
jgi:hypothetical protein